MQFSVEYGLKQALYIYMPTSIDLYLYEWSLRCATSGDDW